MGAAASIGAFQNEIAAEKLAQQVEKPKVGPGEGNPPMGSVTIRALKGNVGVIYIGGNNAVTDKTGFELAAGDALSLDVQTLGNLWAYGTKAGDKLCVFFAGP